MSLFWSLANEMNNTKEIKDWTFIIKKKRILIVIKFIIFYFFQIKIFYMDDLLGKFNQNFLKDFLYQNLLKNFPKFILILNLVVLHWYKIVRNFIKKKYFSLFVLKIFNFEYKGHFLLHKMVIGNFL